MSEEEKEGGKYEEPESKGMGDDLEDVSGGTQPGNCYAGGLASGYCGAGQGVTSSDCTRGMTPTVGPDVECKQGASGKGGW
jgi:hypothetical protein